MDKYYKKVDKSIFKYGFIVPREYEKMFLHGHRLPKGKGRVLKIVFKGKEYEGRLIHADNKKTADVYQLRWDKSKELLTELKKEFIQSYFAIESQNYNEENIDKKYNRTNLLGGNQEVLIIKSIDYNIVELETFIKIETIYDNIFKEFVDRNVFGWLSQKEATDIITKSTPWLDIRELKKYKDIPYVVYYLLDEKRKEIYIGSATKLGVRVRPKRPEIPGWNKFRFEMIHPDYHKDLEAIEYHSIMNFARFFDNNGGLRTLGLSDYKLVNKAYKRYKK